MRSPAAERAVATEARDQGVGFRNEQTEQPCAAGSGPVSRWRDQVPGSAGSPAGGGEQEKPWPCCYVLLSRPVLLVLDVSADTAAALQTLKLPELLALDAQCPPGPLHVSVTSDVPSVNTSCKQTTGKTRI